MIPDTQETFLSTFCFHCVFCFYICFMDQKQNELLEKIAEVFMRYGVRSVNMDDIARELKVSKKTLYKYFKDKSDIVMQVMSAKCAFEELMVSNTVQEAENAIDEVMRIAAFVSQELKQVHPSVMYDLEKYYPEAWDKLRDHKHDFICGTVRENLERGIKEGLYRDNLNAEIISKVYMHQMDAVFDSRDFPVGKYTIMQIHIELMRYHIRGVANEKGMKYLAEKIKKEHSNL